MPQVRDLPSDLPPGKGKEPESWPGERRWGWPPSWETAAPWGGCRPRLGSAGCPENHPRWGMGRGNVGSADHVAQKEPVSSPCALFSSLIEGPRLGRSLASHTWLLSPCCLAPARGHVPVKQCRTVAGSPAPRLPDVSFCLSQTLSVCRQGEVSPAPLRLQVMPNSRSPFCLQREVAGRACSWAELMRVCC